TGADGATGPTGITGAGNCVNFTYTTGSADDPGGFTTNVTTIGGSLNAIFIQTAYPGSITLNDWFDNIYPGTIIQLVSQSDPGVFGLFKVTVNNGSNPY